MPVPTPENCAFGLLGGWYAGFCDEGDYNLSVLSQIWRSPNVREAAGIGAGCCTGRYSQAAVQGVQIGIAGPAAARYAAQERDPTARVLQRQTVAMLEPSAVDPVSALDPALAAP